MTIPHKSKLVSDMSSGLIDSSSDRHIVRSAMKFSDRFAQARKAAGLTQRTIADAMGVSVQAVSLWENGKAEVSSDRLSTLAKTLKISEQWLATGKHRVLSDDELGNIRSVGFPKHLADKKFFGNRLIDVYRLVDVLKRYRKREQEVDKSLVQKVIYGEYDEDRGLFGLLIENDDLSPDLQKGDIAVFDIDEMASVGDLVLVFISGPGFVQFPGNNDDLASSIIPAIAKRGAGGKKLRDVIFSIPDGMTISDPTKASIYVMATLVERRTFKRVEPSA